MWDKNDTFINKDWKEIKRQPCKIYARTMWYIRSFDTMNIWKKSEHYSRKYFIDTSDKSIYLRKRENAKFIKDFTYNNNNGKEKTEESIK